MKNKIQIPMAVPAIGGVQQQPFDINEAELKPCEKCGKNIYQQVFKLSIISALAPGNRTNKPILAPTQAFVCMGCGWEFGMEAPKKK